MSRVWSRSQKGQGLSWVPNKVILVVTSLYREHRWRREAGSRSVANEDRVDWWHVVRHTSDVQHRTDEQCQRVTTPPRRSAADQHCRIPQSTQRRPHHDHGCCCWPSRWWRGYDDEVHSQRSETRENTTPLQRHRQVPRYTASHLYHYGIDVIKFGQNVQYLWLLNSKVYTILNRARILQTNFSLSAKLIIIADCFKNKT